ncbi:MAG: DedA family protein [Desulfobulbaceae bacterium]|nr:MAG: DedA family protein [Desulfobulbaceae bacterium]
MDFPALFSPPFGLASLFGLSFLASTVIPLGSEWLLVMLLLQGHPAIAAVTVATLGNTLGACTTYLIGALGSGFLTHRILRLSEPELERSRRIYQRFGVWSLLFTWIPVIGDPLCLLAGAMRSSLPLFLVLVPIGKACRYAVLALITRQGMP